VAGSITASAMPWLARLKARYPVSVFGNVSTSQRTNENVWL
jgi:hypothetical protein